MIKKFKQFVTSTLQILSIDKYILENVRNKRNIFNFVFSVMRHVKATNISNVHDQLIWIFNAIVSELVRNINSFDERTNVTVFFNQLKNKREIWYRIYSRKYNNFRNDSNSTEFFQFSFFKRHQEYENAHEFHEQKLFFQIIDRFQRFLFSAFSNEKFNQNRTDSQSVKNGKARSINNSSKNSNTAIFLKESPFIEKIQYRRKKTSKSKKFSKQV